MPRIPRIVVPGVPHHVTQRGARRMQVFFSDTDYRRYVRLLSVQALRHELDVWAYCLMPNHVHLVAVPSTEKGLARPIGEAHRRFAVEINRREGWNGHLWQERFASSPMDEPYLIAAIRYVLLNPVRAGLTKTATEWPYSSARCHVLGEPDDLVNRGPADERIRGWSVFLETEDDSAERVEVLRRQARVGRPVGSADFIEKLEQLSGRCLRPGKVGRKPKRK